MQNMVVGSFIENIKTKIVIKFHFVNFMTYLARVENSMVIFSASYPGLRSQLDPSLIDKDFGILDRNLSLEDRDIGL